jgi:hypothetical protein
MCANDVWVVNVHPSISLQEKKKPRKDKKVDTSGPMHFTAKCEPVAISLESNFDAELEPGIFEEVEWLFAIFEHIKKLTMHALLFLTA